MTTPLDRRKYKHTLAKTIPFKRREVGRQGFYEFSPDEIASLIVAGYRVRVGRKAVYQLAR